MDIIHPASSQPLIQVRDLRLTLPSAAGPVNILRGIDLDVGTGEAVGIVGPSGSGKTSLLMVLAGLEAATGGQVVLAGQDLAGLDEDALAQLAAWQPVFPEPIGSGSGKKNVLAPAPT